MITGAIDYGYLPCSVIYQALKEHFGLEVLPEEREIIISAAVKIIESRPIHFKDVGGVESYVQLKKAINQNGIEKAMPLEVANECFKIKINQFFFITRQSLLHLRDFRKSQPYGSK